MCLTLSFVNFIMRMELLVENKGNFSMNFSFRRLFWHFSVFWDWIRIFPFNFQTQKIFQAFPNKIISLVKYKEFCFIIPLFVLKICHLLLTLKELETPKLIFSFVSLTYSREKLKWHEEKKMIYYINLN